MIKQEKNRVVHEETAIHYFQKVNGKDIIKK